MDIKKMDKDDSFRYRAAVSSIRLIHQKRQYREDENLCSEDRQRWPCATIKAIEEVMTGEPVGKFWIPEECDPPPAPLVADPAIITEVPKP